MNESAHLILQKALLGLQIGICRLETGFLKDLTGLRKDFVKFWNTNKALNRCEGFQVFVYGVRVSGMWDSGLEFRALGLEAFDFGSGLVRFRVLCVLQRPRPSCSLCLPVNQNAMTTLQLCCEEVEVSGRRLPTSRNSGYVSR